MYSTGCRSNRDIPGPAGSSIKDETTNGSINQSSFKLLFRKPKPSIKPLMQLLMKPSMKPTMKTLMKPSMKLPMKLPMKD